MNYQSSFLKSDWTAILVILNGLKHHEDRWRLHLKKPLGDILAKDITRAHLSAALDAMTRKGIKEETRKALSSLNLKTGLLLL